MRVCVCHIGILYYSLTTTTRRRRRRYRGRITHSSYQQPVDR